MSVVAAILLVVSVGLAVLLGPDLTAWVWGPSLLALGLALLAAVPALLRRRLRPADGGLFLSGVVVAAWFGWRAWASPVAEYGMADGLLLAGVAGSFLGMWAIQERLQAERVLLWGGALLLLASAVVMARQVVDPEYTPGFVGRFKWPSGFFGHYSDCATFLTGMSCLIGGAALVGRRYHKLERWLWGLIAVAAMLAVFVTRSRGGICGAAAGFGVFAVMALIIGRQQGARWFAPGIVALPVIGLLVAAFLFKGWADAQVARNEALGVDKVMDNTIRFYLVGIAVSCIGQHPWAGGGSRSFSWECYHFWEMDRHGPGNNRPEQVHNEILQAAVDYGLIGAGLLVGLLGAVVVLAVLRTLFPEASDRDSNGDGWRLGGVAGLAGILVQSNFSFIFHLVPGALLLGLCLGAATYPGAVSHRAAAKFPGPTILAAALALACAAWLGVMGWTGTRVTAVRWADKHGKRPEMGLEGRLAAVTAAIRLWPKGEFFEERAGLFQQLCGRSSADGFDETAASHAVDDYAQASAGNPFAPGPVVNRANLLGLLGRDAEALAQFDCAIGLEGGMESGFKCAYSKAVYLRLKAERLLVAKRNDEALAVLLGARDLLVKAFRFPSGEPLWEEVRSLRIGIGERLGVLLSLAGRDQEADAEFEATAAVWGGAGVRQLQASHLRKQANRVMYEHNPAEALRLFFKAREVLDRAGGLLPAGVTPEDFAKLRDDLDLSIRFLQGAHVEPAESPGK